MESLRKERECVAAFSDGDVERALHFLTLIDEPKLVRTTIALQGWACSASLLHLSSRNGWFDVVKDLITKAMSIKFIVSPFMCGVDAGGRPGAALLIFIMIFHYCNIN